MSASDSGTVSPVPEHLRTVTPRLVVSDGAAAIAFYARAFGAEQVGDRFTGSGGELIHAEIRIGDSVVEHPGFRAHLVLCDAASPGGSAVMRLPDPVPGPAFV